MEEEEEEEEVTFFPRGLLLGNLRRETRRGTTKRRNERARDERVQTHTHTHTQVRHPCSRFSPPFASLLRRLASRLVPSACFSAFFSLPLERDSTKDPAFVLTNPPVRVRRLVDGDPLFWLLCFPVCARSCGDPSAPLSSTCPAIARSFRPLCTPSKPRGAPVSRCYTRARARSSREDFRSGRQRRVL